VPLTHEKDWAILSAMKSWLQVGVAIAVVLTVTFITIHPDFDLLDTVLHSSHDLTCKGPLAMVTPIKFDGLTSASLPSPEPDPIHEKRGPDSLDLICVRLC
jgi:hypothetical protein